MRRGKTAVELVHAFCGRYIVMKLEHENGGKEGTGASFDPILSSNPIEFPSIFTISNLSFMQVKMDLTQIDNDISVQW